MITIYLMRHGNTEHNKKGIIMGQIDSPLTDEGMETATHLVTKLTDVSFDHIYSSDLGRAFITAHIFAEHFSLHKKLTRAKELREIDYGIYTNMLKTEVVNACPEYKTDASFVFPNGESFLTLQKRAIHFIHTLEKKHKNQTILLVTHAGTIRSIITYFKNIPFQEHLKMKIPHESIIQLIIEDGKLLSSQDIN